MWRGFYFVGFIICRLISSHTSFFEIRINQLNSERQNICQSLFPLTDSISLIELCFFFRAFLSFLVVALNGEVLCRVLCAPHIRVRAHVSRLAMDAHFKFFSFLVRPFFFLSFIWPMCAKKFYNNIWARGFTFHLVCHLLPPHTLSLSFFLVNSSIDDIFMCSL